MGNQPTKADDEKKPVQAKSKTVDTIGNVRKTLKTLEKREEVLNKNVQQCLVKAKKCMKAKNKKGAIIQMKKKKMYEKKLASITSYQLNLINMIDMLENASTAGNVAHVMKDTAAQIKKMQKENNIEEMEDIRADLEDAQADQDEINDLLGEPMGAAGEFDEDDLEEEYKNLLGETEDEDLAAVTRIPTTKVKDADDIDLPDATDLPDPVVLPKPVTDEPVVTKKTEEDELGELAGMFGV
eukprot:g1814.t1